jgi:hypothetical protein
MRPRHAQGEHHDNVFAIDPHRLVGVPRHRHANPIAVRDQDRTERLGAQDEDPRGGQLAIGHLDGASRRIAPHSSGCQRRQTECLRRPRRAFKRKSDCPEVEFDLAPVSDWHGQRLRLLRVIAARGNEGAVK